MLKIGDKVQVKDTGAIGFVCITNRSSSMPIGALLLKRQGYWFIVEDWVPVGKRGYAWIGNEEELQFIPEIATELLYNSFFEKPVEPEKHSGYYQKEWKNAKSW